MKRVFVIHFNLIILVVTYVASKRQVQNGPYKTAHNLTDRTTSGCDPDYGWIPGVDGTKCYMVLRVSLVEGHRVQSVLLYFQDYDYSNCFFNSGDYYYGMTWFEAMSCCYANHGYPAELVSQEEHNLVKNRLAMGKLVLLVIW